MCGIYARRSRSFADYNAKNDWGESKSQNGTDEGGLCMFSFLIFVSSQGRCVVFGLVVEICIV